VFHNRPPGLKDRVHALTKLSLLDNVRRHKLRHLNCHEVRQPQSKLPRVLEWRAVCEVIVDAYSYELTPVQIQRHRRRSKRNQRKPKITHRR
jgi:hypothetical protein